ncbi:MAG: dTMP kinase [Firmicutes bacterium]|nr:dTMP kinase [Bacillota bacterium]
MEGKFIVFEGIDGSGKSTQLKLLEGYLQKNGFPVLTTREPGGTNISERIRDILLNPEFKDLHYRTEALLYASARAQHVEELIKPALEKGYIVLCDRFTDSTLAYQGCGRGLAVDFLKQLNELATGGLEPHLVLIFDIEEEVSLKRVYQRSSGDRLEQESKRFYRNVRKGYLEAARLNIQTHTVLDADKSIEQLQHKVRSLVGELLHAQT